MNCGRSLDAALRQIAANARFSGENRYLHHYGGVWWQSKELPASVTGPVWVAEPFGNLYQMQ
jgi:hypothetical protein